MRLDSVQICVEDLEAAARAYEILLGCAPTFLPSGAQRFQLQRGAVELQPGMSGLQSLRFADGPQGAESAIFNGLAIHFATATETQLPPPPPGAIDGIDHVVIHSPNLDRAIVLWRDKLGLRLALDGEFPARGLRMLFFRSGGVTLEFVGTIGAPADAGGPDRLYGLAYRVRDLNACRDHLLQAGFDVSAIRVGHKPGTSVATVRSGTGDVPTLLLEDPSRGE